MATKYTGRYKRHYGSATGHRSRGYNGPKYYINKYDDRLRGAYHKFSTGPMPDLRVRTAQLLLTYLGYDPGLVDGWFGPNTLRALNDFRGARGETEFLSDGPSWRRCAGPMHGESW
jgi:hypothetical protein